MPTEILLERDAGVATIVLNAPDRRNALTRAMARELVEVCEEVDADQTVGAVVVRGEGGFFCAGGDRQTLLDAGRDPATPTPGSASATSTARSSASASSSRRPSRPSAAAPWGPA